MTYRLDSSRGADQALLVLPKFRQVSCWLLREAASWLRSVAAPLSVSNILVGCYQHNLTKVIQSLPAPEGCDCAWNTACNVLA